MSEGFDTEDDELEAGPPPPDAGDWNQRTDDYIDLLSHRRRRYVLHCLSMTDDPVRFDELVDRIVRWEREMDTGRSENHRRDVAIDLHHHHLPKLIEQTAIDYDRRTKTIRFSGDETLERWLTLLEDGLGGST